MTSKLSPASSPGAAPAAGERRASLGTIPDYAFPGPGVRIIGTTPGSPAEKAGLRGGDIIVKLGEATIGSMREFSDALKAFWPGETVNVSYQRDGQTKYTHATLVAR